MARRKKVTDNETLSKETKKVQETLVKDLFMEEPINPSEIKEEPKKIEKIEKKEEFKVGDRVKLKPDVETDTLGRRIHNGIRNYTYTILAVRLDGFISIECLTYSFLVRKDQVNKV